MSRLIYVPQFPVPFRYNSWWFAEFTKVFKKKYDEVTILGFNWLWQQTDANQYDPEMFSPINEAIKFETEQINDYMKLNIKDDNTLFLADISFPGIFCNVLYHKPCPKMFAFCHATSLNKYDYFTPMRKYKSKIEYQHAKLFDGIFFGSRYSVNKTKWDERKINCHVIYLPDSPDDIIKPSENKSRSIDLVSVCRPSIQKINKRVEKKVEKALGKKIHREHAGSWEDYSELLANSKVLIISSKEDSYNYTILDAIKCGCVPMVPDKLCFPEILPSNYRYKSADDLIFKLKNMFKNNHFILPDVICRDGVNNFFNNIITIMKQ